MKITALVLMLPLMAHADNTTKWSSVNKHFFTGNDLMRICSGDECTGYFIGIAEIEENLAANEICLSTEVTGKQVHDVAMKYIRNNPEKRDMPGWILVWHALKLSFPCGVT
jgi:Rap1a immunity proteins